MFFVLSETPDLGVPEYRGQPRYYRTRKLTGVKITRQGFSYLPRIA